MLTPFTAATKTVLKRDKKEMLRTSLRHEPWLISDIDICDVLLASSIFGKCEWNVRVISMDSILRMRTCWRNTNSTKNSEGKDLLDIVMIQISHTTLTPLLPCGRWYLEYLDSKERLTHQYDCYQYDVIGLTSVWRHRADVSMTSSGWRQYDVIVMTSSLAPENLQNPNFAVEFLEIIVKKPLARLTLLYFFFLFSFSSELSLEKI